MRKLFVLKLLACLVVWIMIGMSLSYAANAADSGKFSFRTVTTFDGLSSNIVNAVYKDERGFVWLGTQTGLDRFDGVSVITYPQFSQDLIHLSVVRNEPNYTYLDIINSLLSTYMHLKDMYKNSEFENKYLECNENSGEDIVDDYEIIE